MKIPSFGYSLKESLETLLKNTEAAFLTIDNRIVTEDVRKLSIERNILDYLRAHDNRIKISEASLDLHIANKEIEDAIISLETKGFLRRSVEEH
jgi:predicted DNA-binding transcriptional regulator